MLRSQAAGGDLMRCQIRGGMDKTCLDDAEKDDETESYWTEKVNRSSIRATILETYLGVPV